MTLLEKKNDLLERLAVLDSSDDRLVYIVELARKQPPLPSEFKTPNFRVEGCLSNLWFVPRFEEGKCHFRVDADSQIVRAIAALLAGFYTGHAPEDILRVDPSFLAQAGITQHLSTNRRNGLSRLWAEIQNFSLAQLTPPP